MSNIYKHLRRNPFWPIIVKLLGENGYHTFSVDRRGSGTFEVVIETPKGRQNYTFKERASSFHTAFNFASQFKRFIQDMRERGYGPAPDHRVRQPGGHVLKQPANKSPDQAKPTEQPKRRLPDLMPETVARLRGAFTRMEPVEVAAQITSVSLAVAIAHYAQFKTDTDLLEKTFSSTAPVPPHDGASDRPETSGERVGRPSLVPPAVIPDAPPPERSTREEHPVNDAATAMRKEDMAAVFALDSEDFVLILEILKGKARLIRSGPLKTDVAVSAAPSLRQAPESRSAALSTASQPARAPGIKRHRDATPLMNKVVMLINIEPASRVWTSELIAPRFPEYAAVSFSGALSAAATAKLITRVKHGHYKQNPAHEYRQR